jgi:hypothetical protein
MAKAYEMEMLFSVSVGLRQINDIMAQMGCNDELQILDAVTVSVKQVLSAIPNEEYIRTVAEAIRETYKTEDFTCTGCNFKGYKYLREITIKEDA